MKLNIDCMRSVLLELEETPYQASLSLGDLVSSLSKQDFEYQDICYSVLKLNEAGYISANIQRNSQSTRILSLNDITFSGHQFLENIRSDSVWNNVKAIAVKIGSNSIASLTQIATGVITAIIKSQLGLI